MRRNVQCCTSSYTNKRFNLNQLLIKTCNQSERQTSPPPPRWGRGQQGAGRILKLRKEDINNYYCIFSRLMCIFILGLMGKNN